MLDVKQVFGELVQSVKKGKFNEAAIHLDKFIKYKPDLREDWLSISKLAMLAGEVALAKESLRLFTKNVTSKLEIDLAFLTALIEVGEFESAVKKAELLYQENSSSPQLNHFLSTVYLQSGDSEKAAKFAQQTLSMWPLAGEAWLILVNSINLDLNSQMFERMLACKSDILDKSSARSKSSFLAALAKVYEDNQKFTLAFECAQQSKSIAYQGTVFDEETELTRVQNIIKRAPVTQNKNDLKICASKQSPVFIIGLPRSGTTLLEQILSSHTNAIGGGEFNGIERAARCLTQGEPVGDSITHFELTNEQLNEIRRIYLKFAQEKFGEEKIVVDKSLSNNRFVWLIRQVFPDSPVIFLRRNPLDTAWSCYKTHFNMGMSWTSQLPFIAQHFNFEYELYEHWNNIFGSSVLRVNYAELINNTEDVVKFVAAYCQLEFEASMLQFYQSTRPIFTASTTQVRKKIYSTSITSAELEHLMKPFVDNFRDCQ